MKNNTKLVLALALSIALIAPSFTNAELVGDFDPQGESSCIGIFNNLRYRSTDAQTNDEVSLLQDFLQTNGYLDSSPTGFFGILTTAAVKKFQVAKSISSTGFVGPLTREAIRFQTCGNPGTNTTTTTSNTTPCSAGALFNIQTGASCANNTTAQPSGLKLTATQATDGRIHVNASFDPNKYDPISVTLNTSCPTSVSAVFSGSSFPGKEACNSSINMDPIAGPGAYRNAYTFTNTTGSPQRVNFQAVMNGPSGQSFGNYASASIDIPANLSKPDITVSNVVCSPVSPIVNERLSCSVTVYNNSPVSITKSFDVNVQGTIGTISAPLGAWQSKTVTVNNTVSFSTSGDRSLYFPVDIWNSVDESNEDNNTFTKIVTILPLPPLPVSIAYEYASESNSNGLFTKKYYVNISSPDTRTARYNVALSCATTAPAWASVDGVARCDGQIFVVYPRVSNTGPATFALDITKINYPDLVTISIHADNIDSWGNTIGSGDTKISI